MNPRPIEYAEPSTRQPAMPPRWYQLDYSGRDLALILAFLAAVVAIASAL